MKRTGLAVLIASLAVAASLGAQAPPAGGPGAWYTATTYIVKPGMVEDLRALFIKETNPAARKGGLQTSQVWRFNTGNTDRLLRIVLHNSLADRDGQSAVQKGMTPEAFRAYAKKVEALIESRNTYIGRQRLDMGHNPAGSPAPKIAERYVVRIAQGRNAEYLKYVQAFLGAAKKTGHRRAAGQIMFGPNATTFVSNTYYDSWADLEKGRPPDRAMSASELAAFNQLNSNGLITVVSRDIMTYDAEASMAAPAAPR
jgi:hypothetical protein